MFYTYSLKWKPLLISVLISLAVGALAGLLTHGSTEIYENLLLPYFSPPAIVFPIVWTILYILMGISAYIIYAAPNGPKGKALGLYVIQLIVNFCWPIIFFNMQAYLLAFLWLLLLWFLVFNMILYFARVDRAAAVLQIPYLIWLSYAIYLSLGILWFNR